MLTEGYNYAGVKGDIKVWNPYVESDDEYSTSRISLRSGPWYDFESVEAGWAVSIYQLLIMYIHICLILLLT